ncbi:rodlin RdlB [Streptomyces anthocyanicus]|uniref:rodlin RdlB n=1 Tax=unclassified Streptomyces TaxID=2593676 RepID=UPI0029BC87FC|nr:MULTISPECIES: rodlin RdlB [unclassified Streptomyces]MDX3369305.1 rodlin RdlB [Streptomyces sp. ME02-6987-2C]MDX3400916.1 rodlin RdlB [Streptomyces sp. ME01-18h]MDX3420151.1 rodlin RdlB [Streptomyces sp. ME02-6985-2c]
MIKKVVAYAAIAASVMGASAAAAPQAMAIGDDSGPVAANGNGASQYFGNSMTTGNMSPQMALIQGSFNKPCIAVSDIPVSVIGLVPIQDLNVLGDDMNQQCAENSTQAKRDGALAHLLEDVSILSSNGEGGKG